MHLTINNVKSVQVSSAKTLIGLDEDFYARHIVITTDQGEFVISVAADTKELLEIQPRETHISVN